MRINNLKIKTPNFYDKQRHGRKYVNVTSEEAPIELYYMEGEKICEYVQLH